jgi:DNA replication and repair protein RecF
MFGQIKLHHFRCFTARDTEFVPGLNFIVGPNARGKTSLLEALCILLRLQSPRVSKLATVIQHGRRGFAVDGFFAAKHLQFYFSKERKKLVLDSVVQASAHEYLQTGRLVWFANADIDLVRGGSDLRRRLLDFIAVQRQPGCRTVLREYERALRSRNLLLRQPSPRWKEIEAFDPPLIDAGNRLIEARRQLAFELNEPARTMQGAIGSAGEHLSVEYRCGVEGRFADALQAARADDARLRQTTVGPHRDDLGLLLDGAPAALGSEGQQRTLVLALKLGAAQLLATHFAEPPALLIDDIFGELDPGRRNALLAALPSGSQKIITTTHLDWMEAAEAPHILRME